MLAQTLLLVHVKERQRPSGWSRAKPLAWEQKSEKLTDAVSAMSWVQELVLTHLSVLGLPSGLQLSTLAGKAVEEE
jgi:hypothetical protein